MSKKKKLNFNSFFQELVKYINAQITIKKNQLFFLNYDLSKAYSRQFYNYARNYLILNKINFSNKIVIIKSPRSDFNNFLFFLKKNYNFKIKKNFLNISRFNLHFIKVIISSLFKKLLIKKKIDLLIYVNNDYKLKYLQKILENSDKFIGVLYEGFRINGDLPKNFIKINPKFFLSFLCKSPDKKYLELVNKILIYKNILEFYRPNKIFFLEGDSPSHSLLSEAGKKLNIKTYCLQYGFYPSLTKYRNKKFYLKNYFYDFIFLSIGKYFINFLKKKKMIKKYHIVGSPVIFKKKIYPKNKIVFLFTGLEHGLYNSSFYEEYCDVVNYTSKNYSFLRIVIRSHPNKTVDSIIKSKIIFYPNVELHDPFDFDLSESLDGCFLSVHNGGSSTIIEALINQIPTVIYNPVNLSNNIYIKKYYLAYQFRNKKKLIIFINNFCKKKIDNKFSDISKKFLKKVCLSNGNEAVSNIQKIIFDK